MENKEQMIQVANNCSCFKSEAYCAVKSCTSCKNYKDGACFKGMFESTLMTID